MQARGLLVALETSSRCGSVAIRLPEGSVRLRRLAQERRSAADLMPAVRDLLAEAGCRLRDVRVAAFSQGPGSFTGLRIGATVARMLRSVAGARIVAVPSLQVVASNALEVDDAPPRVLALIDARRGRVYAAAFEHRDGRMHPLRRLETGLYEPAEALAAVEPPFWILGEGVAAHREACERSCGTVGPQELWIPSAVWVARIAADLARQGRFCSRERIVPLYIRPPECEEVYEQRRATARARRGE